MAATVIVTPGANCVKLSEPAAIPAIVRPKTTRPAAAPARPPVMAPSMTNGPRTIHLGAPTSCMIATSSRREWMAARMLLMVTVRSLKSRRSSGTMRIAIAGEEIKIEKTTIASA